MAINTDASFERSTSLNEGGGTSDFADTQKLLGVTVTDGKEGLERSCSESRRASVKSSGGDQVSHTSGGTGEPQSPPLSPEPDGNAPEPRSYMWIALLSCFCPAVPFNIFAIYFSHASCSMRQTNDFEGARRLGRRSLLFSIIAIALGLGIILYLVITAHSAKGSTCCVFGDIFLLTMVVNSDSLRECSFLDKSGSSSVMNKRVDWVDYRCKLCPQD
ncbi:trafficking regulator of GLUT4 (SLC2A4) 1b [Trichomycterus rosablanca]|uniref:trafficking regulator of GLUT4 (SLC2A4) 1b n=1 Tax=Trichomycterus rosablanca TaxID=2290929 RepID=UPI002F35DBAE